MNKTEAVRELAKRSNLSQDNVREVLDQLEALTQEQLKKPGGSMALTGFLTLERKEVAPRTGVNPRSGVKKEYPATARVAFKAGAPLKRAVKGL